MSPIYLLIGILCVNYVTADVLILTKDGRFVEEDFRDVPSTFGNGLPYEGLHGMIVNSEPSDACTPIKRAPPLDENFTGKWIVLIARYNCSFEMKIRIAQEYGYDAVIVYNVRSDSLEPMSAKNSSGIHIPSVFVSESTGTILRELYCGRKDFFVIINSETPFNINTHLLLPFAIVVGICFLIMVIFMIAKCITDRRRQRRDRLSSSSLNKIPTHKFQKGDPYETCAICLDDYVDGEKLRVLPCAHAYHTKCIDPWLTKNRRVCPVCKRKVFAHDETRHHSSDSDSDDSDDTTPLLHGNNQQRTTGGGTFTENSLPATVVIRTLNEALARFEPYVNPSTTASDHHSINGEQNADSSDWSLSSFD